MIDDAGGKVLFEPRQQFLADFGALAARVEIRGVLTPFVAASAQMLAQSLAPDPEQRAKDRSYDRMDSGEAVGPVPRKILASTVSAWSSIVWATAMRLACPSATTRAKN